MNKCANVMVYMMIIMHFSLPINYFQFLMNHTFQEVFDKQMQAHPSQDMSIYFMGTPFFINVHHNTSLDTLS